MILFNCYTLFVDYKITSLIKTIVTEEVYLVILVLYAIL